MEFDGFTHVSSSRDVTIDQTGHQCATGSINHWKISLVDRGAIFNTKLYGRRTMIEGELIGAINTLMNQARSEIEIDYGNFDYGDPIARWLVEDAWQINETGEFVGAIAQRLCDAGIPLYRLSFLRRVLHPDLLGRAWFWRRGQPMTSQSADRSVIETSEYQDNPLPEVFDQGKTIRVRIERLAEEDISYPILKVLMDEGVTDYIALPVVYSDGHIDALTVASDRPGGFSRQDLDRMFALQRLFARIAENLSLRILASNLLDVYVGQEAGEQIMDGRITRGDSQSIHAVIWLSDLRGFTPLSDQLSREELVDLLNEYFDCMATAVRERGGEIIKFIGDAMLAIFRVDNLKDLSIICAQAADAAEYSIAAMDKNNQSRIGEGKSIADVGIAIHEGEVMFGNIGAAGRLDFTVIGPAVNQVARVESLCRDLDERILMTDEIARHIPGRTRDLGEYALKGVADNQRIYALI